MLKNKPGKFRDHRLQSDHNINIKIFSLFVFFRYVLKLATCIYKENILERKALIFRLWSTKLTKDNGLKHSIGCTSQETWVPSQATRERWLSYLVVVVVFFLNEYISFLINFYLNHLSNTSELFDYWYKCLWNPPQTLVFCSFWGFCSFFFFL